MSAAVRAGAVLLLALALIGAGFGGADIPTGADNPAAKHRGGGGGGATCTPSPGAASATPTPWPTIAWPTIAITPPAIPNIDLDRLERLTR